LSFVAGEVRVFVDDVAAVGVDVRLAPALDDLECRPARAVEQVVEEREGEGLPLPGACGWCVQWVERG
jgi:hypothetical protein